MSLRREFVELAKTEGIPFGQLCERFRISRPTGYKWLNRALSDPQESFSDRSRRPYTTPGRTSADMEYEVITLRRQHEAWGGRKISQVLKNRGHKDVPAPSTITHILHRYGLIEKRQTGEGAIYQRFEHDKPNQLWQIDFKGHFAMQTGRCGPLTVLDDYSRYNVVLHAMHSTNTIPVKQVLTDTFQLYGLPYRINADNGQPWGGPRAQGHGITQLTVWLIRLGVKVSFSRPAHPQTNGKDERFHRTLKAEVLKGKTFRDLTHAQKAFDEWRAIYNYVRPHDALGLEVPASRYQPSPRPFPEYLPDIEYSPDDVVVTVTKKSEARFKKRRVAVSKALVGLPIAFRPVHNEDGVFGIYFCHHRLGELDLRLL